MNLLQRLQCWKRERTSPSRTSRASSRTDRCWSWGARTAEPVLCLQLSTQQKREGQESWLPLGAGAWDRLSRPSFVRLDRVIELRSDAIRRQGAVLDPARFEYVARALRAGGDWT